MFERIAQFLPKPMPILSGGAGHLQRFEHAAANAIEGAIVVEFYIDETGRPRMPVAVAPSDSFLAAAAVFAIKQWRFAPPKHRGQPVLAHAMQTFVFKAPLAPSPSS